MHRRGGRFLFFRYEIIPTIAEDIVSCEVFQNVAAYFSDLTSDHSYFWGDLSVLGDEFVYMDTNKRLD
jgi:hypothetical protein